MTLHNETRFARRRGQKKENEMQGQIAAQGISLGIQLLFALIQHLGERKTGMTGKQKMEHVIANVLPVFEAGESLVIDNQKNATTQLEIAAAAQAIHQTLLVTGAIQDTATLEASDAPAAPAPIVMLAAPPAAATGNPPAAPAEQAKYEQWLRLATPGVMPSTETLKASLYLAGDALYNDGDASNACEFYYVSRGGTSPSQPNSPTGRIAKLAGFVG